MIDIDIENFESEVVTASHTTPVLLDFWAPWCGPCKILGPTLEKIESQYAGRFILAKIDSDQQQQIASMFGIRSIPTVILMVKGQPVDGFQGAMGEADIKAFLDKHLPLDSEAPLLANDDTSDGVPPLNPNTTPEQTLDALAQALAAQPENHDVRFQYIKRLLENQEVSQAQVAFAPVIAETALHPRWAALQAWFDALEHHELNAAPSDKDWLSELDARINNNKRDFSSRFLRAQVLMRALRWPDAMDELLEILMRDKNWEEGRARKTYIAILDIITPTPPQVAQGQIPPEDPLVASYRRRLSSVVLS